MIDARICAHCGQPIAPTRRIDACYCDASCRSAARHARTALSTPAREATYESTPPSDEGQRRASEPTGHGVTRAPRPSARWLATYYASQGARGSAT